MGRRSAGVVSVTGLVALGLALGACTVPEDGVPSTPPWALGEQPNFSGTIPNWADGDAIAPGTGGIFGMASLGGAEDVEVGFGSVNAGGGFTFGLQRGTSLPGGGGTPAEAICAGLETVDLTVSDPQQRVVAVDQLEVPELFVAGQHARPLGGILIRETPPTAGLLVDRYGFVHASADGAVTGTCSGEGLSVVIDFDLRRGWNSVHLSEDGGFSFTTAAIPDGAAWYLVNPVVLGRE